MRKALVSSSHVVIHPKAKNEAKLLPYPLSEKGNKCSRMASVETSFSFNVSHTFEMTEGCRFDSSKGVPQN